MIEARLRCDRCGDVLEIADANSREIRVLARSKGWTVQYSGGGKDFCLDCSAARSAARSASTELPEIPGTPIPGFPGYTVDRMPDGSWGVRTAKAWNGQPAGRFLTLVNGRIFVPDASGKQFARYPETWARFAAGGAVPAKNRKLSVEQARSVFHRRHELGESLTDIAKDLGVSVTTVTDLLRGEVYADETEDLRAKYGEKP